MSTRNAATAAARIKCALFPFDIFILLFKSMAHADIVLPSSGVYLSPMEKNYSPGVLSGLSGKCHFPSKSREFHLIEIVRRKLCGDWSLCPTTWAVLVQTGALRSEERRVGKE